MRISPRPKASRSGSWSPVKLVMLWPPSPAGNYGERAAGLFVMLSPKLTDEPYHALAARIPRESAAPGSLSGCWKWAARAGLSVHR
jgi:hypothetical protein